MSDAIDGALAALYDERSRLRERLERVERAIAIIEADTETCANGHPRTAENTRYRTRRGNRQRVCIPCTNAASRRHYRNSKEPR